MHIAVLDHQNLPPPQLAAAESIFICLLGSFRILHHGHPANFQLAGKGMTLLSELALRLDTGVRREELLETLWPEHDAAQSTVSLNSLVYSLQRRLRCDLQDSSLLVYTNGCYSINKSAGVGTDIALFDAHVRSATQLIAEGEDGGAAHAFQRAVDLYQGDLCLSADVFAVIERERLRASFLSILAWLADRAYRQGDEAASLGHALRLLSFDPCREDAHRVVMRIRVRQGERAQALRQYRICEEVLRREFDAAPEPLTRDLFEHIRAGRSDLT